MYRSPDFILNIKLLQYIYNRYVGTYLLNTNVHTNSLYSLLTHKDVVIYFLVIIELREDTKEDRKTASVFLENLIYRFNFF